MPDYRPRATGTSHTLPFERLPPEKFEELCLWLLRREGYEVRHRGLAGQDGGADLVADRDGERLAVQCKREQNFGPKKATDAVTKLVAAKLDPPATRLLLAVSWSLSAEAEEAARAAADGMPLQIWAMTELNERANRYSQVLREFFQLDTPTGPAPLEPPAPPPTFTGRVEILNKLVQQLVSGENVGLTALQGMGGIGKTALAKKLAQRLRQEHQDAFPGGVLWGELGPEPDVLAILDGWAGLVGANWAQVQAQVQEPAARAAVLRQILAQRGRLCVVLDDVWDSEPARTLLTAVPDGCSCLLTSRNGDTLAELRCRPQSLSLLEEKEAIDLLEKHRGDLGEFKAVARKLAKLVDRLPLALEIAAGLIDSPAELPELLQRLEATSPLSVLRFRASREASASREDSVAVCLTLSYETLEEEDQRRFRALGVLANAPFDEGMLAAVWGEREVSEILRRFVRRNLLQRVEGELFRQHALLRACAWDLAADLEEIESPSSRFVAHCQSFVKTAPWQSVDLVYEQIRHAWSFVEHDDERAPRFALAASRYQRTRGRRLERLDWLGTALSCIRDGADLQLQADLLHSLALTYNDLGQKQEALQRYNEALNVRREVGDRAAEGTTLNNIALVYSHLGQKQEALQRYNEALNVLREVGDRAAEGTTLNNIALVYDDLGQKQDALQRFNEALNVRREVGDRAGEGTTLNNIAGVYDDLGQKQDALQRFNEALNVTREVGDRWGETVTLYNIAFVLRDLDRLPEAVETLEACIALETELGHPNLEADSAVLEQFRQQLAAQS